MMRKPKRTLWYSRKGISTIIATIIIVSVSIVMAIAVAFWAMGIGNSFTKFEKLEFTSIYADYNMQSLQNITIIDPITNTTIVTQQQVPGNYTINIVLKNTGSAAATINGIFLNGRPYSTGYSNVTQMGLINTYLPAGRSTDQIGQAKIFLPDDPNLSTSIWSHGNSVDVVIQTAAGRSYSSTVVLP
jgi:archaeal type IV pilus assembly protein PilA